MCLRDLVVGRVKASIQLRSNRYQTQWVAGLNLEDALSQTLPLKSDSRLFKSLSVRWFRRLGQLDQEIEKPRKM